MRSEEEIRFADKLIEIFSDHTYPIIKRSDIASQMHFAGFNVSDTYRMLRHCNIALVKRSPATYDVSLLRRAFNIPLKNMLAEQQPAVEDLSYKAPSVNDVEDGFQIYDPTKIDATQDPSIDRLCKTSSYQKLERVMNPRYPLNVWIHGDTGLGKSSTVLSIARAQKRPVVMVNMSFYTDVDDLIGGLRLIGGQTIMRKGPVAIAMEMGCILLLDECDACNPQLLIDLHPVLDGKGILMKKANTMIFHKHGFCVLSTANTKGRGDMSGDFVISQIIGKPFLDRFDTAVEFVPPSKTEIEAILKYEYRHLPGELTRGIGAWFQQIQDARANGVLTEGISIRKVKSVAKMMVAYGAKLPNSNETKMALEDALNLKDQDVTNALVSLWDSMLVTEFKA